MSAVARKLYAARCKEQGRPVPGTMPDVNSSWRKRPTVPAPKCPEPVTAAQLRANAEALKVQASQLLEEADAMLARAAELESGK